MEERKNVERNNILAVFVIFLIFISIVTPTFFYFKTMQYSMNKGVTSAAAGTISLSVSTSCGDGLCEGAESCSSCAADCGSCPSGDDGAAGGGGGGGGGAGAAPRTPVTYMHDFREEGFYLLKLYSRDKIIIVFEEGIKYDFLADTVMTNNRIILKYASTKYDIKWDEIAYFDLDLDGINDLEISFMDDQVRWTALSVQLSPEEGAPTMTKEKIQRSFGGIAGIEFNIGIVLLILAILSLAIFVYQHLRLTRVEKGQSHKIRKMYSKYKSKKRTSDEKIKMRNKLSKQKEILTKAYKKGYVSKASFSKGNQRISNILGKL